MKYADERSPQLAISASSSRPAADSARAEGGISSKQTSNGGDTCDETSECIDSVHIPNGSPSITTTEREEVSGRGKGLLGAYKLVMLAGSFIVLCALLFALPATPRAKKSAQQDFAYVNLMRHAEKDDFSGNHLSKIGTDRSLYYAKCMDPARPKSTTFPVPVGALFAQLNATIAKPYKGNYGLSQRSFDTLVPLSQATGIEIHNPCKMTDFKCFVKEVEKLLKPNSMVVVTWEHKLFPKLLRKLGVAHENMISEEGMKKWPQACDAKSWNDPRSVKPGKKKLWHGEPFPFHSACFDIVWQVKFVSTGKGGWEAVEAREIQNGFGGSADSPCAEGLASSSELN